MINHSHKPKKRIAFLCPYPFDTAPGQRFRFEQYLEILKKKDYEVIILPFLHHSTYSILYREGFIFKKITGIFSGYLRRCIHLFRILPYDYIFIYRELSPLGFPVFEWIISKILHKKIIYDFDDAIWLEDLYSENEIIKKLKYSRKVELICKWAYKISVGNAYLQDFAKKFNSNAVVNPTTIDDVKLRNKIKDQRTDSIVIGWTGSHSTIKYLDDIYPLLKKLEQSCDFTFHVIADREPKYDLKKFVFKKWNKNTELEDLLEFNIGIMPLPDNEWTRGKCGFKALQYMALGIPAVVSPVGVNKEIVIDGVNGFCCVSEDAWLEKLMTLVLHRELREELGIKAVEWVQLEYSVSSNTSNFIKLFD